MKNESGLIAVDFLISLTFAVIFSSILFVLCVTLTVVEISQYVAFSVGRAYSSGHLTLADQQRIGMNKYQQFVPGNKVLLPALKSDWYELQKPDIRDFASDYSGRTDVSSYTGVRMQFVAKILSMSFGSFGKTNTSGKDLSAYVTGLMIREPTTQECQEHFAYPNLYQTILGLDPRFQVYTKPAVKYVPMEDNGC